MVWGKNAGFDYLFKRVLFQQQVLFARERQVAGNHS